MQGREFQEFRAFAAVADAGSFSKAAARLQVSPSALSQSVRSLEARLGLRLLNRTTRDLALTTAGEHLFGCLTPAIEALDEAVASLSRFRTGVGGRVRVSVVRLAYRLHVEHRLGRFVQANPDVTLDITLDDGAGDPVADGFDVAVRLDETVELDMVALPLGRDLRQVVVAAPDFLARFGVPSTPADLLGHRCVNWRWPGRDGLHAWEFQDGDRWFSVAVTGSLVLNDRAAAADAAEAGIGLAQVAEPLVRSRLSSGALVAVLRPWEGSYPGFRLCFPRLPNTPPAVRAFIDLMRAAES